MKFEGLPIHDTPRPRQWHHLQKRIEAGEGFHLDFKYHVDDAARIARSLSAFANCGGGSLLVGVKDNGRIIGIQTEEEYYVIESANQRHLRPRVPLRFVVWPANGKTVLEVKVPAVGRRPVYVWDTDRKWRAYLRMGDRNIRAPLPWVKGMVLKHRNDVRRFSLTPTIQALIRYFQTHPAPASLDALCRHIPAHRMEIMNALAAFVAFDLLEIGVENESYCYAPRDPAEMMTWRRG